MSTTQLEGFLNRAEDQDHPSGSRLVLYSSVESRVEGAEHTIRYARATRTTKPSETKHPIKVLRRLSGFLVEMQGTEARVAFVENGQTILYDLPADHLRRSGITSKNQPFQMDEIEIRTKDGLVVGYRFQPLAKLSDAYIEPLNFDEERKRKRNLLLEEFSKTKG